MTKKAGGSKKNAQLVETVNQIFHSGTLEELPDGFESIDAAELIREIGRQAEARQSGENIILPADSTSDAAKAFLQALDEGRGKVTGDELDAAWEAIRISMDFQVSGDEAWCPRILPNGSVAWRNFHRVLGFDNDLRGSIGVDVIALRKELADLAELVRTAKDPALNDPTGFSLLHRDEKGLRWTREIPDALSSFGQTLVIMPLGWIKLAAARPEHWTVLGSSLLEQTAESSRGEMTVLRVFKDRVFVYGFYRADDDYDTVLELFGNDLGGSPEGTPVKITVTNDFDRLKQSVTDSLRQNGPGLFTNLYVGPITRFLAEKALFSDYAREKTYQILHWMPIFGESASVPASDRAEPLVFFEQSARMDYRLAIVQFGPGLLKKIKGLGKSVNTLVESAIPQSLLRGARLCIPDVSSRSTDKACDEWIAGYASTQAQQRFDTLEAQWLTAYREEKKLYGSDEESFLQEQELKFSVLLEANETNPAFWHKLGLSASDALNGGLHIIIPLYGFYQGYDCGDLDTGNHDKFIDQAE